ncbi:MAG: hypothetical protein ACRCWM_01625 [Sarcina sp.]
MGVNFKGKVLTRYELGKLSTDEFMELFREKKLDYQKFGGYIFKNRNLIIDELIRQENFFKNSNVNQVKQQVKVKVNKELSKSVNPVQNKVNKGRVVEVSNRPLFPYAYEELVNLDYTAIGDLCVKESLIPKDKVIYDYSKTELIGLITNKYDWQYNKDNQNLMKGNNNIY